jgi:hypothetical protein
VTEGVAGDESERKYKKIGASSKVLGQLIDTPRERKYLKLEIVTYLGSRDALLAQGNVELYWCQHLLR